MRIVLSCILFCLSFHSFASHVMGGGITYTCDNSGNYIFQLVYYRDCNGADVNDISQNISVWNHPVLTTITLDFVNRTDLSPFGTEVAGGGECFACGSGAENGNGIGAIEKVVYESDPIQISGIPPNEGWVFTFDDYSRSANITNLVDPESTGITLVAKIYNANNPANTCVDNSPQFLQEPNFISCAGQPYTMNLNAVDPDLDSIAVEFARPLNNLEGNPYNPPSNPNALSFEAGFSYTQPTPSPSMNAGNVNASIDASSGELTFTSFTIGSFNIKLRIKSYRNGVLISEIDKEMQLIVTNCSGNNNPPTITPPFGASFETTVIAGDPVNFTLSSTDVENLQDGSPQSNYIYPSGLLFGPDPTLPTNCIIEPCPTLGATPPASGVQGASIDFNWQTACEHLVGADGNALDVVPYNFVFKVQDDYCAVPEVVYATVTINVVNPNVIAGPSITCIQGDASGEFTINWEQATDVGGAFVEYQVYSLQDGLIASINDITTTSFVHNGVDEAKDYYIGVQSGCNGNTTRYGDTISNIYLELSNLNPSIANLSWNDPLPSPSSGMHDYYYIYREYPAGTWTLLDSVPYGTTNYSDEIDICDIFLNYQIVLPNASCDFTSQIEGDNFDDQIPPDIPTVYSTTIDTLTGETTIHWNENDKPDTYGYLIYYLDPVTGFLVELDTVYGISNTSYTYTETENGSMTYTVAAFDSCESISGAPFNLSARDPNFHSTIFLEATKDICNNAIQLDWSSYVGWEDLENYTVFVRYEDGSWENIGTSSPNIFNYIGNPGEEYCFAIRARNGDGRESFSNIICERVQSSPRPSYSYIHTASVNEDDAIEITYSVEQGNYVSMAYLEKRNKEGSYEVIDSIVQPTNEVLFLDEDVEVNEQSYTYRVLYLDSCGNEGEYSNTATTILLNVIGDDLLEKNYLSWSAYSEFNGAIIGYNIYRGVGGEIAPTPFEFVGGNVHSFEDDISNVTYNGKMCYRVEAIEGSNVFNSPRTSFSNKACAVVDPTIYIPNAFMPNGVNKVFIPVLRNYEVDGYAFTIFDRWGQVVFRTNSPDVGWNGLVNNSGPEAETATYVYMLELQNGDGEQIIKRGHVTLLR